MVTSITRQRARRGSAYLLVVGVSAIVSMVAAAGVLVQRIQGRTTDALNNAAEARLAAQSALELATELVNADANWRTTRTQGTWLNNVAIGRATVSVDAADPTDANVGNRPHDSIQLTATARVGTARYVSRLTLAAAPTPLTALRAALHTGGQIHLHGGAVLTTSGGLVSTNGSLRNDGAIYGSVECASLNTRGSVSGAVTSGAAAKAMPPASTRTLYQNLGTAINPGSSMDKQALGPGRNPWGSTNADGVYVWQPSGDATIQHSRIVGTLVVVLPAGKKLTIDNKVSMQPARSDYPALIVVGNADFKYTSNSYDDEELDEEDSSVNFNPAGVPNNAGVTDTDKTDQYFSEIRGLVHVTGTLRMEKDCPVRGAIICESTASSDAVEVHGSSTIYYDAQLMANPPQGYTSQVKMVRQAGSVQQIVN